MPCETCDEHGPQPPSGDPLRDLHRAWHQLWNTITNLLKPPLTKIIERLTR